MRIIFSLKFELEPAGQPGAGEFLVVPLDHDGQSADVQAESPKRRVVDLCPGDYLIYRWQRRRVLSVCAYRECQWNGGELPAEGCIVANDIAPPMPGGTNESTTDALRGP